MLSAKSLNVKLHRGLNSNALNCGI